MSIQISRLNSWSFSRRAEEGNLNLGFYGLQAYDSTQMVGHAIDRTASGNVNDKKTLLQERLVLLFCG